jgi:hypothetical protein
MQDLSGLPVISQVGRESEVKVRIHGVKTLILQFVCLELRFQANAAAFLPEIDDSSYALGVDTPHALCKLVSAVTSQRSEDITCLAFRMDAKKKRLV